MRRAVHQHTLSRWRSYHIPSLVAPAAHSKCKRQGNVLEVLVSALGGGAQEGPEVLLATEPSRGVGT